MSSAQDDKDKQESWVEADPSTAGRVLFEYAEELERRNATRIANWEIYAAIFDEQISVSLRSKEKRSEATPALTRNANATFNVSASLVETENATVTEAMPRPTFLTEDGNRPQQDLARELQLAVDGSMSDLRTYDTVEECEIDKGVFGTGVTKVHQVNGRLAIDRVLVSDILVDEELLGSDQKPRAAIHRIEVTRRELLSICEKAGLGADVQEAIKKAPALVSSTNQGARADLIVLYDAYSLPLDEQTPGRHAWTIDGCEALIFVEPWTNPRLPFVFQFWRKPRRGFYGIGIIEQCIGPQIEVNRFYRNMSRALKRWGVPTALVPTLSKINTQAWTNNPDGQFIPFDPAGGAPVFWNGQILSPECMQWLQFQVDILHRRTGIPQNVAWAQREPGVPSAAGQREISQKAAARLAPQSKQYERVFVEIAWLVDFVLRELKENNEELVISTADHGALHKVELDKALSLKPGTYKVDIFAGNFLSRHPATKREEVQELARSGAFTQEEVRALVGPNPDIEAIIGKEIDVKGLYRKLIKLALEKGQPIPPENFWPALEVGKKLYTDALFEGLVSGVPATRLDLLRDWLKACKDIMDTETPQQPQAAAPAEGSPPEQPTAMPQGVM